MVCEASSTRVGLIVDGVSEVLMLPEEAQEPTPAVAVGPGADYVRGIANLDEQLIILLGLDRLFSVVDLDTLRAAA